MPRARGDSAAGGAPTSRLESERGDSESQSGRVGQRKSLRPPPPVGRQVEAFVEVSALESRGFATGAADGDRNAELSNAR